MLSFTNTTAAAPAGGATYAQGPALLTGGVIDYEFCWIATARDMFIPGGSTLAPSSYTSLRTSQQIFCRGLAETVHYQTSSSIPWQWRRIVFTYKGPLITLNAPTNTVPYSESSSGWTRTVNSWTASSILRDLVFKGKQGKDWSDIMIAPIDTQTITVMCDKRMTIQSGSDAGINRIKKFWHPANKNIMYNGDEDGNAQDSSTVSTPGKPGMGDMYVYDVIAPQLGASTSDQLSWEPCATLYWHER